MTYTSHKPWSYPAHVPSTWLHAYGQDVVGCIEL